MGYQIIHKPTFLEDYLILSKVNKDKIEKTLFRLMIDPLDTSFSLIKKFNNYKRLWTCKITNDLHLLYAVHEGCLQLLDIGSVDYLNDKDLQENELDQTLTPDIIEKVLDPSSPINPSDFVNWPNRLPPKSADDLSINYETQSLPFKVDIEVLKRISVPERLHIPISHCSSVKELLDVCKDDAELFNKVIEWLYGQTKITDIAQEPNYVLKQPQDLQSFASGKISQFPLYLDREQNELATFPLKGPMIIRGGPGSGKSTLALYHAKSFAEKHKDVKILFTTYTRG